MGANRRGETAVLKVKSVIKDQIILNCLKNRSFFAAYSNVNVNLEGIDEVKVWMRNQFMPAIDKNTKLYQYAKNVISHNANAKSYVIDFIRQADFNIADIKTEKGKFVLPPNLVETFIEDTDIPVSERERIKTEKTIDVIKTAFEHTVTNERGKETYSLQSNLQSDGTRRIMGIETAIFNQLEKQAFLTIDELECSLHPELVEFILVRFLQKKDNQSQLLISTHNDLLLKYINDIFRKDSIWFANKLKTGQTELYSLTDFQGINRISSIQKAYRNNLFGALPKINM